MMIKKIFTLCVALSTLIACSEKQEKQTPFLNKNKANEVLLELSTLTNADLSKDDDLQTLVIKTQKAWFQRGKERWEMDLPETLQKNDKNLDKIIHLCTQELHLNNDKLPDPKTKYDGVFFLGASFSRVIARLDFYLQLVNQGLTPKDMPLWVLAGERNLNASIGEIKENFEKIIDPKKAPIPFPTNEKDMVRFVFYHRLPSTLQATFIDSAKEEGAPRSTTESNISAFLDKTGKTSGHFLCISSQPYVYYQETAILAKLNQMNAKKLRITGIGPKTFNNFSKSKHAATLLDNVARILYNVKRIKV